MGFSLRTVIWIENLHNIDINGISGIDLNIWIDIYNQMRAHQPNTFRT